LVVDSKEEWLLSGDHVNNLFKAGPVASGATLSRLMDHQGIRRIDALLGKSGTDVSLLVLTRFWVLHVG
jgi:hypothetical protein